jgi:hypothetical protein
MPFKEIDNIKPKKETLLDNNIDNSTLKIELRSDWIII